MAMEENLPNREIIDATQDAVLNAAGNVAAAIENTAHEISGHGEIFYQSAEFWVAVSFVLVVVALARPVGKVLYSMLKKRGENIAERIHSAAELKEEAQKLLAQYEKQYRLAQQEAKEILAKSEREVNILKNDSLAKMEHDMAVKEADAKARIATAQQDAVKEISAEAAEKTIAVVRAALIKGLDDKAQDKLIDQSIEELTNLK